MKLLEFDGKHINHLYIERLQVCTKDTCGWSGITLYTPDDCFSENFELDDDAKNRFDVILCELKEGF